MNIDDVDNEIKNIQPIMDSIQPTKAGCDIFINHTRQFLEKNSSKETLRMTPFNPENELKNPRERHEQGNPSLMTA